MMRLIHLLWSLDYDGLTAKLQSIGQFLAFAVTTCSVAANVIPKYERMANQRMRSAWRRAHQVVMFGALNWRVRQPEKPTQVSPQNAAQGGK